MHSPSVARELPNMTGETAPYDASESFGELVVSIVAERRAADGKHTRRA